MQTTTGRLVTMVLGQVLAAVMAVSPAPALAASIGDANRLQDVQRERHLRLAVDLAGAGQGDTTVARMRSVGGRTLRGLVAYRFRIVVTDSAGALVVSGGAWQATVRVGGRHGSDDTMRPLVYLDSRTREVTLPRPLGFHLAAGDSVDLVALHHAAAGDEARMQLVIDYEHDEDATGRLAVTPIPAAPSLVGSSTEHTLDMSWTWTPERDGRLLAIAGLPLDRVREVMLEDAATGTILWSTTVSDAAGRTAFGSPGDVLRLGAAMRDGQTYRLRATLWGAATARGAVVALVLPSGRR